MDEEMIPFEEVPSVPVDPDTIITPLFTEEARRNNLINLAYDLAERRLREGTATAQEITYLLRLSGPKADLQYEIMRSQQKLLDAKTKSIESMEAQNDMYQQAIEAMRIYSGGLE